MEMRFYLDTSIWMDMGEERKSRGINFGENALILLSKIRATGGRIVVSTFLLRELASHYSIEKIRGLTFLFEDMMIKVGISDFQASEARLLSKERNVPFGDAIHAVIARNNNAILVSRDRHFSLLADICRIASPEELI